MKRKTKYYIAYGSNMDEEQMAYRCPEAKLIGKSEVAPPVLRVGRLM